MPTRPHPNARQTAVIRTLAALAEVRGEWDALATSANWAPLDYDWIRACVPALHAESDLRIITIREGGLLVGAAPMVRRRERGIERLEFIGMRTLHEPSGFLHRDGASLTALLQATLALKRPLALQRVDAGSPVERILRAGVGRGGWVIGRDAAPTVSVPIAGTWAGYLASLSGKLRWQQKRARTLAEALGPVTIEKVAPSASEVGALFDTFAALEASGWKGERRSALLTKEPLGHFFRAYAHAAAGNSALRVWFLRIGTRVAAAQLTVEAHHAVWVLKIAYDESLAQVSPGFQLTFRALEDAFVAGVSAYEFLGSADDWKLRWRGRLRAHRLVLAYPRSTRGVLGLSVDVGVHAMRAAARRLRWRPS